MMTPPPSWDDLRRPREQWDGPFMLKDDSQRAVDAGYSAISVSNHGGNNLDGTPASIRALPAIAEAVGDDVEVLLDGRVPRGADVVNALALGGRAVMIGRASRWGLAAAGQAGVENVLDIMRAGIDSTLLGDQADRLDRSPVLRQVQQGQAGPVGVRRPHQRRLPAPLRLDQHRPTSDRQAPSITR
jgi:isopentenyl diphosphate isomerase/L-lactate dehydrogenase-like FMN-dependent dehydrogenase